MTLLGTMLSERESNFTLFYDGIPGSNKSHRYSLCSPVSSPFSPPWSPYCSPDAKFQAAIPFAWEDRPGVAKHTKSPARRGYFHEEPRPPPSEFSVAQAFQAEDRSEEKADDDPLVSALVECTKQAVVMSLSNDHGRQRRHKQGHGWSAYSCGNRCDVNVNAQTAIRPPYSTQLSRQKKNRNKKNEREPQKSYAGYNFGEDYDCVALLNRESQRQTSSYYADLSNMAAHKNAKLSSGYKLLLSKVSFLFAKRSSDVLQRSSDVIYRA